MADEKSASTPEPAGPEGEDQPPQVMLPFRAPLPPPPDVTYDRPSMGRPVPPPGATQTGGPAGRRGSDPVESPTVKLGAGLAAGTTFVASVVAGFLIGQWIDRHWNHSGMLWGTLVFSLLGIAAGFLNLFRILSATDRTGNK